MKQDEKKVWFWRKYCLIMLLLLYACLTAYPYGEYLLRMHMYDVEELEQRVAAQREELAQLEAERKGAED